jgi:DnaJ domain
MFHAARDASGGKDSATSAVVIDLTEPESCDIIGVDVSVDVEDLLDHDDENTAEIIVLDDDDDDEREDRDLQLEQSVVPTKGEIKTGPRGPLPCAQLHNARNKATINGSNVMARESTAREPALEMVHDPVQSRIQQAATLFRRDASRPSKCSLKQIPPASLDPPSWLMTLVKAELLTTEPRATSAGEKAGNPLVEVNKPKSRHVGPSGSARAPEPPLFDVNTYGLTRKQPAVKDEICCAESSEQAIPSSVEVAPIGKRPNPGLRVSLSASIQPQRNKASCPLAPPTTAATGAVYPVSRGDIIATAKMACRKQLLDRGLANETALSVARQTEDRSSPTTVAGQTPAEAAPPGNKPATDNIRMHEERPSETALAAAAVATAKQLVSANESHESVPVVKAEVPFTASFGGCNFIVIDDSSDDENYLERPRIVKKRGRPTSSTSKRKYASGSKTTKKRCRQGSYSPWRGWNIHFSEIEALHLQERMLEEAAARMAQQSRIQNASARETRPRRIGIPAIAKPLLDVAALYPEHWQWKEPYACLGLPLDSPFSSVKAQYRRLARIYHPDKSKHSNAAARFHGIARAYRKLCCDE